MSEQSNRPGIRKLPFDVCRCQDTGCPRAINCTRYIDRERLGERTPISASMRASVDAVDCEFYIPYDEE